MAAKPCMPDGEFGNFDFARAIAEGSSLDAYTVMISNDGIFAITIINPDINFAVVNAGWVKFQEKYKEQSRKILRKLLSQFPAKKRTFAKDVFKIDERCRSSR